MGIVSFPLLPVRSVLAVPLQAMAAWFGPTRHASTVQSKPLGAPRAPGQLAMPFGSAGHGKPSRCRADASLAGATIVELKSFANKNVVACARAPANRLKIVREFDSTISPAFAGRMVISGRMADVCAELERMTQRQSADN